MELPQSDRGAKVAKQKTCKVVLAHCPWFEKNGQKGFGTGHGRIPKKVLQNGAKANGGRHSGPRRPH